MVVRNAQRLTKDRAKTLIAAGLHRAVVKATDGIEEVAIGAGCSRRCLEKALAHESLPEAHTILNSLIGDATVLDEALAHVGFCLVPLEMDFNGDMAVITELSALLTEWLAAMADGKRDHVETQRIAARIRHLLPTLRGVVGEADRLRMVA